MSTLLNSINTGLGVVDAGINYFTAMGDRKYQRELNNQLMQREDTAIQRKVKDLEAAGISKNLALGISGASSSSGIASTSSGVNPGFSKVLERYVLKEQLRGMKLDNDEKEVSIANALVSGEKTKAEIDEVKANTEHSRAQAVLYGDQHALADLTRSQLMLTIDNLSKDLETKDANITHLSQQDLESKRRILNLGRESAYLTQQELNLKLVNEAKTIENEYLREKIETSISQSLVSLAIDSESLSYLHNNGYTSWKFGGSVMGALGGKFERNFQPTIDKLVDNTFGRVGRFLGF